MVKSFPEALPARGRGQRGASYEDDDEYYEDSPYLDPNGGNDYYDYGDEESWQPEQDYDGYDDSTYGGYDENQDYDNRSYDEYGDDYTQDDYTQDEYTQYDDDGYTQNDYTQDDYTQQDDYGDDYYDGDETHDGSRDDNFYDSNPTDSKARMSAEEREYLGVDSDTRTLRDSATNKPIIECFKDIGKPAPKGDYGNKPKSSVFRLTTSTKPALDETTVSVFALASLQATESVGTAHERDMVQWRDMVGEMTLHRPQTTTIAPADEVLDTENASFKSFDMQGAIGGQHAPPQSVPLSSKLQQPAKTPKMMTASSFFGSQTNTNKSQKNTTATKTKKALEKIPASSKPVISKSTLSRKENHKPSEMNRSLPIAKVGNADDFVADEEDSDDEMTSMKREPARLINVKKRQIVAPAAEPTSRPLRGSMDTFAKEVSKDFSKGDPQKRQKRRRKKLVEKTTMVGGYLRTETVTVWEDILSADENDEEEKRKDIGNKIPTSKRKNANSMKQKSLMGFFAKK
ncbi:MAG: hypothetical protein SGBAC_006463 [Bacillariaceae sp.]